MSRSISSAKVFEIESTDESESDHTQSQPEPVAPIDHRRLQIEDKDQFVKLLRRHEPIVNQGKLYPKSLWQDVFLDVKHDCESKILHHLPEFIGRKPRKIYQKGDEYTEVNLAKFSVYNSIYSTRRPGMFEGLQDVASECKSNGKNRFCLDGCIERPDSGSSFVSGMDIIDVAIGGLDSNCHGSRDYIWVQTRDGAQHDDCWYKLISPAPEYATYWHDFIWVANLSKYCIDFLTNASNQVGLGDFRINFWKYIRHVHQGSAEFESWCVLHGQVHDFRKHVNRHRSFLRDQARNVDLKLMAHPVWDEVGAGNLSLDLEAESPLEKTVLTSRIALGFLGIFGHWSSKHLNLVRVVAPDPVVEQQREKRRLTLGFPNKYVNHGMVRGDGRASIVIASNPGPGRIVRPLHQVLTAGPYMDRGRLLDSILNNVIYIRSKKIGECPLGLVIAITNNRKAARVVWLATSFDTICAAKNGCSYYPIKKELFLTDRCNCHTIAHEDITAVETVSLFTDLAETSNSFVRSRQLHREDAIVDGYPGELAQGQCQDKQCPRYKYFQPSVPPHPNQTVPVLQNLSLFSGAGLFDRALEDHGKIATTLSIDHNEAAILSVRANMTGCSHDHDSIIGSVDQQLESYLTGKVPYRQFDTISAGCPCQGFSRLNTHKHVYNRKSQKNISLLASTLSYVDLFLPRYVVIENVPAMAQDSPACAQAISELVALGYQVRRLYLKPDDYGGCTSRERLFIVGAAPHHKLPDMPTPTHGRASKTAIKDTVNARAALSDLPPIGNDTTVNIRFPDHIPLERYKLMLKVNGSVSTRDIVQQIPLKPNGQGLVNSYDFLSPTQKQWFDSFARRNPQKVRKGSKMLRRIDADKPIPAIVTKVGYSDAWHSGRILHYDQHRSISLEEARRAQGLPDWFVLIGSVTEQHKQVGNGVPWALGSAIGRVIGEAWQTTWVKQQATYSGMPDQDMGNTAAIETAAAEESSEVEMIPSDGPGVVMVVSNDPEVVMISSDEEQEDWDGLRDDESSSKEDLEMRDIPLPSVEAPDRGKSPGKSAPKDDDPEEKFEDQAYEDQEEDEDEDKDDSEQGSDYEGDNEDEDHDMTSDSDDADDGDDNDSVVFLSERQI